jgi:hypothetical protein
MTDDEFDALKQAQEGKLTETIALLVTAQTCAGASLILGIARGRLGVLRDLGLVNLGEYEGYKAAFKAVFAQRWPHLIDDELPEKHG